MSTHVPPNSLPDPSLVALVECLLYIKVADVSQVKSWARTFSDSITGTAPDWIYEVACATDDFRGHEHIQSWMSKAALHAYSVGGISSEDIAETILAVVANLFFAQPSEWPRALYSLEWARGCLSIPTLTSDAIYELWCCTFDQPLCTEYNKDQIQDRLAQLLSSYRDRPVPDLSPIVPRLSSDYIKVVAPD